MADISKIKLPDGNTYDVKDASKSSATNWVNGSATGSVRTVGSVEESSSYTIGQYAVAEGYHTKASKSQSHAEGYQTTASGISSHAEGHHTTASGNYSHAEGHNTTTSGSYSHAEGYDTTASGLASHAEGYNTTASGSRSHAEGMSTIANHFAQHVFGQYNIADDSTAATTAIGNYIEIVGNGTDSSACSNARTLDWSGNEVLAGKLTVGVAGTNSMDVATIGQIPNVPSWAMASTKPTYTASEVGALPSTTSIPTKTSDLTNDGDGNSVFATMADIGSLGGGTITQVQTTAGAHTAVNVSSGAVSFNVPTKTSHLTNDSGFITSDSDEKLRTEILNSGFMYLIGGSEYSTASIKYIHKGLSYQMSSNTGILGIGSNTDGYEGAIRLYGSTSNTRIHIKHEATANRTITLPDKTGTVALTSDIPDVSGFITSETDPVFSASAAYGISTTDIANWNGKQAALVSGTNIKTVNGNSLLGSGDVTITETDPTVPSWAKASTKPSYTASEINGLLDFFYPVGSYYETSDTTFDPNVSWGGTWYLEVEGQVHVSSGRQYTVTGADITHYIGPETVVGTSDGGNTTSATGNHTLTAAESGIRAHGHGMSHNHSHNHASSGGNADYFLTADETIYRRSIKPGTSTAVTNNYYGAGSIVRRQVTDTDATGPKDSSGASKTTTDNNTAGNATAAHNHGSVSTMQPYIVVNRWHRTA